MAKIEVDEEDVKALAEWRDGKGWCYGNSSGAATLAIDNIVSLLPKPIEVGARVKVHRDSAVVGSVLAIDGSVAWVRWSVSHGTYAIDNLVVVA